MLLGLDVGTVRVGGATADETIGIPFPKAVWPTAQNYAQNAILELLKDLPINMIVVGLPLDEDGGETKQCEHIRRFCTRLEKRTMVPITFVDEADSSEEAKQLLEDANSSAELLDAYAACCILSRYLKQSNSKD